MGWFDSNLFGISKLWDHTTLLARRKGIRLLGTGFVVAENAELDAYDITISAGEIGDAHINDTNNPHAVTAAQTGAATASDISTAIATHASDADAHGAWVPVAGGVTVTGDIGATAGVTFDGVDISELATDLNDHATAAQPHAGLYALDGSRALTAALNANGKNIGSSGTPAGTVYTDLIAMQTDAQIDLVSTAFPDSTAIEIPLAGQGLLEFITNDPQKPAGTLAYRSTATPSSVHVIEVCGVSSQHLLNVVTGDTVLTGTTGAAGKINVSAGGSSLYFENRLGGAIYISYLRITL